MVNVALEGASRSGARRRSFVLSAGHVTQGLAGWVKRGEEGAERPGVERDERRAKGADNTGGVGRRSPRCSPAAHINRNF